MNKSIYKKFNYALLNKNLIVRVDGEKLARAAFPIEQPPELPLPISQKQLLDARKCSICIQPTLMNDKKYLSKPYTPSKKG